MRSVPSSVVVRRLFVDTPSFGLRSKPDTSGFSFQSSTGHLCLDILSLAVAIFPMATTASSPSLHILVRKPEGFSLWNGPPFANGQPSVKLERTPCTSTVFSTDGSRLMVIRSDSMVGVYDFTNFKEIRNFEIPNLATAALSPCGTYLQTFQKSSTPQEKNVILWKVESGESVYQLLQKNITKTTCPSIRFSSDEAVVCRLATNEIQFFDGCDFSKGFKYRLRVPGVAAVELSKTPGYHIAAFVPESKGVPASVQILCVGRIRRVNLLRGEVSSAARPCSCTGIMGLLDFWLWCSLILIKPTRVTMGIEVKLLTTDGTHEGLVPLRKEDLFMMFNGHTLVQSLLLFMAATIFDKKCNPLLELGTGPYNTIRWNPKGKFICLAGFGNLPGDMAFWDYREKKRLGTTKAECSVTSEWSPNGCYFMNATIAPRLQIDNCIKIFHHNGSLFFKKMFDKLYQNHPRDFVKLLN
ncbi:eukaryotic translation initiation factor 2A isoform X2 [Eucalyptus grandis]|uniref:eukaryotic translation initiation factor 2A isoform X2 n=1 Tax=Eucalyptus grandis TaxID=71139 RepID=UPI00192E94CC|nr:eukaryotic translation initiation factor 2A isoform X2 [Eucalyptus grandis]